MEGQHYRDEQQHVINREVRLAQELTARPDQAGQPGVLRRIATRIGDLLGRLEFRPLSQSVQNRLLNAPLHAQVAPVVELARPEDPVVIEINFNPDEERGQQ